MDAENRTQVLALVTGILIAPKYQSVGEAAAAEVSAAVRTANEIVEECERLELSRRRDIPLQPPMDQSREEAA